jgi:hypothetical protein
LTINISNLKLDPFTKPTKEMSSLSWESKNTSDLSLSKEKSMEVSVCARDAYVPNQTDAITAPSATNASSKWTITALG